MLLRARIVLPVSRPMIEDGAVGISEGRIAFVGRWAEAPLADRRSVVDLGESVLLPGLVNAHCHLDYTRMAGLIPPPRDFVQWIKSLVALKGSWSVEEFSESWRAGAQMLLNTGTTTVADVEAVPELLPSHWQKTPLRVISFRELIHFKDPVRAVEIVRTASSEWSRLPGSQGRVGLSPHAPYTTNAPLLRAAAEAGREHGWRLTTHVAESEAEYEMFIARCGPLHEWLKNQRDMSDCGQGTPVQHLERCGYLGPNLLAVHAIALWTGDVDLLAQRGVSVVHCPRSHAYFGHRRFPREPLAQAGVNLCLGTDSLASVVVSSATRPELSLFAEMQALAAQAQAPPPATIVQMATVNGAHALGHPNELGELSAGARADAVVIPFSGPPSEAETAVVHFPGTVSASMINGQWVLPPRP
jgi:aminodeoxyfutalosine deaminase